MRVILKQTVKGLGIAGAVVEVAEGYGRNFLLPRGLAVEATAGNLNDLRRKQQRAADQTQRELDQARADAAKLEGCTVTLPARSGEGGRLFGSVTNQDVAGALAQFPGVQVDRRRIEMAPIKTLGSHPAIIRLHPQVMVKITVHVVEK